MFILNSKTYKPASSLVGQYRPLAPERPVRQQRTLAPGVVPACGLLNISACLTLVVAINSFALADEHHALHGSAPVTNEERPTPPLSLSSQFHPTDKFDFDGQGVSTPWMATPEPLLLVERESLWREVDLNTGEESVSRVVGA